LHSACIAITKNPSSSFWTSPPPVFISNPFALKTPLLPPSYTCLVGFGDTQNTIKHLSKFLDVQQTGPSRSSLSSRFLSARVSFSRDDSVALDMRRKSAVSRLCGSGNYGPERGADGTLLLR
jgi:hypothetical protein